ncbi:MAG TPA: DUF3618 domain-containing protein [Propionibacteriaceae bacterium]|nr:DUF3618 domain-containing protein [Propionibacteriaceae bacterium]
MTSPTPAAGGDASKEEIEARLAQTRERLGDNIEALEDRLNVPKQAKAKMSDVTAKAKARLQAVGTSTATRAKDVTSQVGQTAKTVSRKLNDRPLVEQLKAYPRAAVATGGTLAALVALLIARRERSK